MHAIAEDFEVIEEPKPTPISIDGDATDWEYYDPNLYNHTTDTVDPDITTVAPDGPDNTIDPADIAIMAMPDIDNAPASRSLSPFPMHCYSCGARGNGYEEVDEEMIQCERCEKWSHRTCVNETIDLEEDRDWNDPNVVFICIGCYIRPETPQSMYVLCFCNLHH